MSVITWAFVLISIKRVAVLRSRQGKVASHQQMSSWHCSVSVWTVLRRVRTLWYRHPFRVQMSVSILACSIVASLAGVDLK